MMRRKKMTNKIFDKIEGILDLSFELCENDDSDVSSKAVKINNEVYSIKKEMVLLKGNLSNCISKLEKKKKINTEDFINALKSCDVNLAGKK